MAKRATLLTSIALVFLIFLIWKDPKGAADSFGTFLTSVGHFFGTVWDKLSEFFKQLAT
jgi:hypothetical protein